MLNCVIVVWFNPKKEHIDNIISLNEACDFVCVVDNSYQSNEKLLVSSSVKYIHNRNQGGIAGAFNRGFDYFISKFEEPMIYSFDQDTVVPANFFEEMAHFIKDKNAKIACPNFFDINAKTHGKFVKMSDWGFFESDDDTTHFCISSGMFISKETYKLLGGFNEELVIDHVDTEFALKAYENGIKIFYNKNVCLNHAIGEREKRKFLGVTIKPNHHSKVRKYYIARNGTYLAFKYIKQCKAYFVLNVARMIHEYLSVILYENDKLRKISAMNKGLFDAVRGRLGPLK